MWSFSKSLQNAFTTSAIRRISESDISLYLTSAAKAWLSCQDRLWLKRPRHISLELCRVPAKDTCWNRLFSSHTLEEHVKFQLWSIMRCIHKVNLYGYVSLLSLGRTMHFFLSCYHDTSLSMATYTRNLYNCAAFQIWVLVVELTKRLYLLLTTDTLGITRYRSLLKHVICLAYTASMGSFQKIQKYCVKDIINPLWISHQGNINFNRRRRNK